MRLETIGRLMLTTGAVLALGACFEREGRDENASNNSAAGNESSGNQSAEEDDRSGRREVDPEILRQIRSDVADYQRQLPVRGDPFTTTDLALEGTELVYTQQANVNLTSEQVDRIERGLPREICRADMGRWIRGGVTVVYRITDPDGDDYRISVNECPEGSGGASGGRDDSSRRDEGSSGGSSSERESGADPALAEELARDIEQFRASLPQQDGPLTTYDVELRGTEIIYFQRTRMNLNDESFGRFERGITTELCRGQGTAQMLRRGGTMTYRITDGEGEVFRTSVRRC